MARLDLPLDLIRDQHAWNRTYEALAASPPQDATLLRRRLLWLSCRIAYHPFWGGSRSTATWAELRRHAREHREPAPDAEPPC